MPWLCTNIVTPGWGAGHFSMRESPGHRLDCTAVEAVGIRGIAAVSVSENKQHSVYRPCWCGNRLPLRRARQARSGSREPSRTRTVVGGKVKIRHTGSTADRL